MSNKIVYKKGMKELVRYSEELIEEVRRTAGYGRGLL